MALYDSPNPQTVKRMIKILSTPTYYNHGNYTLLSMTTAVPEQEEPCEWTCELTNDRGYVVYSALGSFYIPMFVMLFFYWRIYRAAVRTTRAINQGFKTTKSKSNYFIAYISYAMHLFISFLYHILLLEAVSILTADELNKSKP